MARAQPVSELDQLFRSRANYWEVRCKDCIYSTSTWFKDEAEFRGEIHYQHQGGHECEIHRVELRSAPPAHLGFGKIDQQ